MAMKPTVRSSPRSQQCRPSRVPPTGRPAWHLACLPWTRSQPRQARPGLRTRGPLPDQPVLGHMGPDAAGDPYGIGTCSCDLASASSSSPARVMAATLAYVDFMQSFGCSRSLTIPSYAPEGAEDTKTRRPEQAKPQPARPKTKQPSEEPREPAEPANPAHPGTPTPSEFSPSRNPEPRDEPRTLPLTEPRSPA